MTDSDQLSRGELLRMTADVAAAYLQKNAVSTGDVSEVIRTVYSALIGLEGGGAGPAATAGKPAISIKKSVTPEYIVCLEDGKRLKMLKRHLRTAFGMTPEQYRQKWGLPPDYPMVAPKYAAQRSDFAKKIGLGRKPGARRRRK